MVKSEAFLGMFPFCTPMDEVRNVDTTKAGSSPLLT